MNAVLYFSCSGQSKAVAEDLARKLSWKLIETSNAQDSFESVAVVFPVHCQSYPAPLKDFFKTLNAKSVTLIATYGRAHCGNAVYEAAKLINGKIIAASYIPAKHTYCESGDTVFVPEEVVEKIRISNGETPPVKLPKLAKAPFAGLFPSARSRAIIKIRKGENCTGCNTCAAVCPVKAIECGKTSRKCMRCLKCVYSCPSGALNIKKSAVLRRYLKKPRYEKVIVYI